MSGEEIVIEFGDAIEETKAPWPMGDVVDGIWPGPITWLRYWPH